MIKVGDHVLAPVGYKGIAQKQGRVQHISEKGVLVKYDTKGPHGETGLEWRMSLDHIVKLEE